MNQPLGLDDFFVLEAGEYLDRLAALAASAAPPNGDELVRFTRALRGSALMANQPAIARAASALEHLLRGYRDGRLEWHAELPARTREAIDVLRTLVERVRGWTPDDAARAERLSLELETAAGAAPRAAPPGTQSETGVRAFLAREAAALGSVLDQTAKALATGNASEEALTTLVRRLQPLRGLAALNDYPPLPDLLDGIERTAVSVSRLELPPRDGGARLSSAADALVRAAREVADRGRPDANAPEYQRFAALLLSATEEEGAPVVPIESLFFAGEDGVVKRGLSPRSESRVPLGAAAVVSRGEHLAQAADEIAEATSSAQRDLRFHVLLADLRTLSAGLPTGLDVSVESFAVAARGATTRGAAAADAPRFAEVIREAGARLRGYTEITQPGTLAATFEPLIARLEMLGAATAPPPAIAAADRESIPSLSLGEPAVLAAPAAPAMPVVPIETLAPDEPPAPAEPELPIVPIESLAPDGEEAIVAPAPPPGPPAREPLVATEAASRPAGEPRTLPEASGWDLAASFLYYEAVRDGAVPAAVLPGPEPAAPEPPIVAIEELLYGGRAALARAEQIRSEIRLLAAHPAPLTAIQPLVDELLDLVELAIAD